MHIPRKKLAVLAMSAVTAAVVAAPVSTASAKTTKYTVTLKSNVVGSFTDLSGKITSKQLGKGTQTKKSYLKLPKGYNFWKFKGGVLALTSVGKVTGSTSAGTYTINSKKSTGKFKGAKGKGTFKVDLVSGISKFKGTITYK